MDIQPKSFQCLLSIDYMHKLSFYDTLRTFYWPEGWDIGAATTSYQHEFRRNDSDKFLLRSVDHYSTLDAGLRAKLKICKNMAFHHLISVILGVYNASDELSFPPICYRCRSYILITSSSDSHRTIMHTWTKYRLITEHHSMPAFQCICNIVYFTSIVFVMFW